MLRVLKKPVVWYNDNSSMTGAKHRFLHDRRDGMETGKICLKQLDIRQAHEIYREHIVKDFPPDEVKPFEAIRSMYQRGCYEIYGAYTQEELAAYAFFVTAEYEGKPVALLDYFAVPDGRRGKGLGTAVLRELSPDRLRREAILIENEKIEGVSGNGQKQIRKRRIEFYVRCGAVRTGVYSRLYGVDYEILTLIRQGGSIGAQEVFALTQYIYHRMFPASWFPKLATVYCVD